MVAGVVSQHDILHLVVLRNTCCDGEHDSVAEGNDGGFHVLFVVVSFRNGICAFKQRTLEELFDEGQADYQVRNTQTLTMQFGKLQLTVVMIAAVMEGNRHSYTVLILIKHCGGV